MKEREAVGNDLSLSSFQAEINYQNSVSFSGESNRCPVYSLINTAVLWSCTIKPCFHYLHCRHYYDHWNRVTVRSGCCEDSGASIFYFGSLALYFSECNVLWRRMSCSLLCTSVLLSIQPTPPSHRSVFEMHKEHVCRCDSIWGLSVCRTKRKTILSVCIEGKRDSLRHCPIFRNRSASYIGLNENFPPNTQNLDLSAFFCHQLFSTVPAAVCFFTLITSYLHNFLFSHKNWLFLYTAFFCLGSSSLNPSLQIAHKSVVPFWLAGASRSL